MAYKQLIRPILFRANAETVHDTVARAIRFYPTARSRQSARLAVSVAGVDFTNPVGLAAGFDKDCSFFQHLYKFDFGALEVGTITPMWQAGNPTPRIARFPEHDAIFNKMGFPNVGLERCLKNIRRQKNRKCPIGANIGANKDSIDKISDYVKCYRALHSDVNYVTVNVSSPNTPGLREFEKGSFLKDLLDHLSQEIAQLETPIFLKVSPDLNAEEIEETSEAISQSALSGIIVGNTTVQRPIEAKASCIPSTADGGLSGAPLRPISKLALQNFSQCLAGAKPIISVGGIASAEDAFDRILCGASAVQIYTSFIYEGPAVVKKINRGLLRLLDANGFETISDAIGARNGMKSRSRFRPHSAGRTRGAVSAVA